MLRLKLGSVTSSTVQLPVTALAAWMQDDFKSGSGLGGTISMSSEWILGSQNPSSRLTLEGCLHGLVKGLKLDPRSPRQWNGISKWSKILWAQSVLGPTQINASALLSPKAYNVVKMARDVHVLWKSPPCLHSASLSLTLSLFPLCQHLLWMNPNSIHMKTHWGILRMNWTSQVVSSNGTCSFWHVAVWQHSADLVSI